MEVLEAFDLTGSYRDAAVLAGCSHHTVARYVAAREAGGQLDKAAARPQTIDGFLPKVAEWVLHSRGKIRADRAHEKLLALGYRGSERTTRRAVHEAKVAFSLGQVRVHRPWVTEPGMWLQYDFGDGPVIDGRKTVLFCAWLAWSRFRVVLALRDRTAPTVFAALDVGTGVLAQRHRTSVVRNGKWSGFGEVSRPAGRAVASRPQDRGDASRRAPAAGEAREYRSARGAVRCAWLHLPHAQGRAGTVSAASPHDARGGSADPTTVAGSSAKAVSTRTAARRPRTPQRPPCLERSRARSR
jgi:hypothetical protein